MSRIKDIFNIKKRAEEARESRLLAEKSAIEAQRETKGEELEATFKSNFLEKGRYLIGRGKELDASQQNFKFYQGPSLVSRGFTQDQFPVFDIGFIYPSGGEHLRVSYTLVVTDDFPEGAYVIGSGHTETLGKGAEKWDQNLPESIFFYYEDQLSKDLMAGNFMVRD